jgi:multicomponent Na+:H+ antiporter subunit B
MTHLWATIPLGITDLKVSTVYLFDLGVYLAVWGGLGGYVLHLLGRMRQDDREGSVT